MLEELKSAKKVVGIKQLTKALKEGRAAKVFIAADAEVRVTRPIEQLCQSMSVPTETAPSMEELGRACSIEVGAAAAAILRE